MMTEESESPEAETANIGSSSGNPTGLFCPCCDGQFLSASDVVQHISSDQQCGSLSNNSMEPGDDYSEDVEAAQDGMFFFFF